MKINEVNKLIQLRIACFFDRKRPAVSYREWIAILVSPAIV